MVVGDAGRSAAYEAADAAGLVADLEAELRRAYTRQTGFAAAAFSEPRTALALRPLEDRGWRVLHDRLWPGSTRANVDHLVIGPHGVAVVDTKHWAGPVEQRRGRLFACEDDRHDAVEDLLRLVSTVEDLLLDLGTGPDGQAVGLSAVHVLPVLALTSFSGPRRADTRVGRVRLTALRQLPTLLAAQPTVLAPAEITRVADVLSAQMPPSQPVVIPRQRGGVIAVPVRPRTLPTDPGAEPDALFDVTTLAEGLADQIRRAATAPMLEWMGFLHPAQARLVRRASRRTRPHPRPGQHRQECCPAAPRRLAGRNPSRPDPGYIRLRAAPCPCTKRPCTSGCRHHRRSGRLPGPCMPSPGNSSPMPGGATPERQRPPWVCPRSVETSPLRRRRWQRQYRKFDEDFKQVRCGWCSRPGKPIAQVARELGINEGTLGNWCARERRGREGGNAALSEDERAELERLRKENTELRMQRDVLKRSVALWVNEAMGR